MVHMNIVTLHSVTINLILFLDVLTLPPRAVEYTRDFSKVRKSNVLILPKTISSCFDIVFQETRISTLSLSRLLLRKLFKLLLC